MWIVLRWRTELPLGASGEESGTPFSLRGVLGVPDSTEALHERRGYHENAVPVAG